MNASQPLRRFCNVADRCENHRYIVSYPDFAVSIVRHNVGDQGQWRYFHNQLLDNCEKVWDVVKDVLCFDSPEGHDLDDPEDDGSSVDVKDTLSFSWRALKEARYASALLVFVPIG